MRRKPLWAMLSRMSPHDIEVRLDAQRDRARILAEVRRHPIRDDGKHRDAERLGGVDGDTLREYAVHGEAEMAVLLRAAERQDGAVVVPEVRLHLHPIHVRDAHVSSCYGFEDWITPADCACDPRAHESARADTHAFGRHLP